VAIDIEAISNTIVNGIGIAICDDKGHMLLKREYWLDVDYSAMDPDCKTVFWDKNLDVLQRAKKNALPEQEQIESFVKFYDSIAEQLSKITGKEIKEKDLKLVSDNAEFDFGRLTPLVAKYCKDKDGNPREPLRYTTLKEYRSITDYSDAIWDLGIMDIINELADLVSSHDHYPMNDAQSILIKHLIAKEFMKNMKYHYGQILKEIAKESSQSATSVILSEQTAGIL
jgi:hypothetical protein